MALNPSLSVLVVDDYQTMVRIIRNLLGQLGVHDVDDASDGQMALEKMRLKRYDLVISDWNMQPMSGYDLLCKVRESADLREVPFIMVTAESKTDNVVAAKKAGVNNFIVKPFNAQTLRSKIEAVCNTRGFRYRPFAVNICAYNCRVISRWNVTDPRTVALIARVSRSAKMLRDPCPRSSFVIHASWSLMISPSPVISQEVHDAGRNSSSASNA